MHDLRDQMLAQIRDMALSADQIPSRRSALRSKWRVVRRGLPPTGQLLLLSLAVVLLLGAVTVFVLHWPPGGGAYTSSFVFTQGASLVFVVILLSLLSGPVSAGQQLGWDSGWILRDRQLWLGFGYVASISLTELWLGWLRPERPEAGATVLLTGSGLAATAFVAWRVVYLADPITQLRARARTQIPAHMKVLRRARRELSQQLRQHITDLKIAGQLELENPVGVQQGLRSYILQLRAVAERAISDGRWDLASQAHDVMTESVRRYVSESFVIAAQDLVLDAYCEATNDLHDQAQATRGRSFAQRVVIDARVVANAVAVKDSERFKGPRDDILSKEAFGTLRFVYLFEAIANRRLADDVSADAPAALQAIGELASAAAAMGDSWTSASYAEKLVPYATVATVARKPHLAWPAWDGILRTLLAIAQCESNHQDPRAFALAGRELTNALDGIGAYPHPLHYSGFEPIGGVLLRSGSLSLRHIAYPVWASARVDLDDLDAWGVAVSRGLSKLAAATLSADTHGGFFAVKEAAESIHHLNIAAIIRGWDGPLEDVESILRAVAFQLSWIRGLALDDSGAIRGIDFDAAMQVYVTDALVALHLVHLRDGAAGAALTYELTAFASQVGRVEARDASRGLAEMVGVLGDAVPTDSGPIQRALVESEGRLLEASRGQPYDSNPLSGWGHLHRGDVSSTLYEEVEAWLRALPPRTTTEPDTQPATSTDTPSAPQPETPQS